MYKSSYLLVLIFLMSISSIFAQETSYVSMTKEQLVSLIQTLKLEKKLIHQNQKAIVIEKKMPVVEKQTNSDQALEVDILLAEIKFLQLQLQQLSTKNTTTKPVLNQLGKTDQDLKILTLEQRILQLEKNQLITNSKVIPQQNTQPNSVIVIRDQNPVTKTDKNQITKPKEVQKVAQKEKDKTDEVIAPIVTAKINRDSLEIKNLYKKLDSLTKKIEQQKSVEVIPQAPVNDYQKEIDDLTNQLKKLELANAKKIENEKATYEQLVEMYGNQIYKFLFGNNSAVVTSDYYTSLDSIAQELRSQEHLDIVLKGFASNKGNSFYNEKLAQKRAQNVKKMLIIRGVYPSRMAIVNHGVDYENNENEARRVEIIYVVRK